MALLDAWPDAVKEKDNGVYSGHPIPLYFALKNNAPEVVAMALFEAWPEAAGVKDVDRAGDTILHLALQYNASDAVEMALLAAWPDAVKEKNKHGDIPLHYAAKHHASDSVVRALVAAFQCAVKEVTAITPDQWVTDQRVGGDTVLHTLATAACSSIADCRNANTICFTLVENRASLTAINALGQTPAEASQAGKVAEQVKLAK